MKLKFMKLLLTFLFLWTSSNSGHAEAVDAEVLLNSMVNNGLISQEEARRVIEQSKDKVAIEKETIAQRTSDDLTVTLPKWVKNITLQGDLTVRVDQEKIKDPNDPEAHFKGRLRYRLGILTKINNKVNVAAGFVSGTNDPRSAFQTFSGSSEKSTINLDYAYAEWNAAPWFRTIMGKFNRDNYLWTPSDMLWDADIHPFGGAVHIETPGNSAFKPFINSGVVVLQEFSGYADDPTMFYVQPGVSFDSKHMDAKVSAQRYAFNALKDRALDHSACTNSGLFIFGTDCNGALEKEYDSGGASAEIGFKADILGRSRRLGFFGEMVKNLTTSDQDMGWAAGGTFGDEHIDAFGAWRVLYQYTYLQRDAILDILPNSDRYHGETDVRGPRVGVEFGLWKDITLAVNYFHTDSIKDAKPPQTSILSDITYRF